MESVKKAVARGAFVQLAIDYGKFNDMQKRKTGDPNFRGGHSVGVMGERKKNGVVEWLMFDPLDDGRRSGIPKGPRWVKRGDLIAALKAFGTGGSVYAGVFGVKK